MFGFILRRLVSGVVLLLVISVLAYTLLYVGGGNIARRILGQSATEETVAQKTAELGLDQPIIVQYFDWLSRALTGDLGTSWFTGQPVTEGISSRLAVTLSIVIGATIITAIVSVILGVWAAVHGGWVDKVVQGISILGFAIPGFLIALGLVTFFALNLKWFKPTGYVPFAVSPTEWLASVTLPIIALSIGCIAGVTQQVRGSVVDALHRDYVRTLRSRGLSHNRVVYKHVLRNAGGPALAILAVQFVGLLGGAIIVEQIFAIPGLGQVAVIATSQGDIPMVMGLVVATAAIVVIVNLLIDLLQGWLNPKVRLA
ncbi:ABC transporter permease [Mycetocola sp.]|jgi:peptide/nickel transport system permease protein|uniref:ABC transporter permease n=1 Tax=Mycetocola sp. TaxID=1871042 RepID=UPI0026117438|nr:ABC transporter permease [Mycetocola sp.]MCU1419021.1 transporter permease [Mycetocola sp.]MCU1561542.1 transporter permease [Mycetocola sp.]